VFPTGLGHVGMYVGNGMYVNAPRTGDVVKVVPLRGVYLAVRPG
jgi:cell wall-associated NlpC family hydrolase